MHYFSGKGCSESLESMHYCIGILMFGVSDPEMKNKTTPSNVEGLDFQDAVAYAKREAATLKAEGCDVVIALSHTLDPKNVAAQVDGVDL